MIICSTILRVVLKRVKKNFHNEPIFVLHCLIQIEMQKRTFQVFRHLPKEEPSALAMKLEQLAESAGPTDFDGKAGPQDALPYDHIKLHSKLNEITARGDNFEYNNQQAISIASMPSYVDKSSRDIAMAKPWSGQEGSIDASLRMLDYSIKPMKVKRGATVITPPTPLKHRIHNAREGSLDYKLSKIDQTNNNKKNDDDDDGWSERYKERLLGPSVFLNDSFASVDSSIKSLADQKIRDAQRRGEFDNLKGRGQSLDAGYSKAENMFIDRTEYQLNNILKRQDALPPWIEKQGSVELQIKTFRDELNKEWTRWAVNEIREKHPRDTVQELTERMRGYCTSEISDNIGLRSDRWLKTRGEYIKEKIRQLNDVIRGYNLQAPLASQKMYLMEKKELNSCYKRVASDLPNHILSHFQAPPKKNQSPNSTKPVSYEYLPQRDQVHQQPVESLSSLFGGLFGLGKRK